MTLREFAESIINDPTYRETVQLRARAGTLPPDVELFLLELAEIDSRQTAMAAGVVRAPMQSRTLAFVRHPNAEELE